MRVRQGLAVLLALFLACPVWAHPSDPRVVGTAGTSQFATVRGSALLAGGTIFSGDRIDVKKNGVLAVAVAGGAQVRVGPESSVQFTRAGEKTVLEIGRGSAAFRIPDQAPFEAAMSGAILRAAGTEPLVSVVVVRNEKSAMIAVEKGTLAVASATKNFTLKEGEGAEVTLEPSPEPPQWGDGRKAKTLSGRRIALFAIIAGGTITAIAIYLNTQDRGLSDTQKRNAVSPFRFP